MPFSFTETKENAMNYIYERPMLSGLFFNPFVVCIVLTILIMVIHYVFDNEYEESDCETHLIVLRHTIVTYISLICIIILHDILIKDRYRMRINELESEIKNKQSPSDDTIYQKINVQ